MKFTICAMALLVVFSETLSQVPREPKNVAIFLYDNVELLDFAGPAEVFAAAGFKTYTVSVDGESLKSQGFLEINPEFSITTAPLPDIIVFPGGNSSPSANDTRVIDWIKSMHRRNTQFLTVCTGAFIVAKAGLLENKKATTHWGSTRNLAQRYPGTTVLENTRWVDNGLIITTAGVSAGIDGALHLVARIKGLEEANRTARYMEYDKWDPRNGLVEVTSELLSTLLNGSATSAKPIGPMPYCGEFMNAATILIEQDRMTDARKVVDAGLKFYPNSFPLYKRLGTIHRKLGLAAPIEEAELIAMVRNGEVDKAIQRFGKEKKQFPGWKVYSEAEMQKAGYYLMLDKKNIEGAIKVFKLNTIEFPESADTFDCLGEALLAAGKREEGIENYKIAAAMGYENAKKVLRELKVP